MTERFWLSPPLACVALCAGIAAISLPAMAQSGDESPFLLQEHGGVRILRGLDDGKNFEATPAEKDETAEAPGKEAPPEKVGGIASSETNRSDNPSSGNRSDKKIDVKDPADRLANGGVRKSKIRTIGGDPADRLANGGVSKPNKKLNGSNPANRLKNGGVRKRNAKFDGNNPADRLANGGVRKSKIRVY
jgi:hypothetical protein